MTLWLPAPGQYWVSPRSETLADCCLLFGSDGDRIPARYVRVTEKVAHEMLRYRMKDCLAGPRNWWAEMVGDSGGPRDLVEIRIKGVEGVAFCQEDNPLDHAESVIRSALAGYPPVQVALLAGLAPYTISRDTFVQVATTRGYMDTVSFGLEVSPLLQAAGCFNFDHWGPG